MKSAVITADSIDLDKVREQLPEGPYTVHQNGAVLDASGKMVFRIVYADPRLIAAAVLAVRSGLSPTGR
jgi:hypothetical protein